MFGAQPKKQDISGATMLCDACLYEVSSGMGQTGVMSRTTFLRNKKALVLGSILRTPPWPFSSNPFLIRCRTQKNQVFVLRYSFFI